MRVEWSFCGEGLSAIGFDFECLFLLATDGKHGIDKSRMENESGAFD